MATQINQLAYAQSVLDNRGIGGTLPVEKAVAKTVDHFLGLAPATLLPVATEDIDKTVHICKHTKLFMTSVYVRRIWNTLALDGVSIVFLGETHNHNPDTTRATGFVAAVSPPLPTLVVSERGLLYPAAGVLANSNANETNLTTVYPPFVPPHNYGLGLSFKERNWVIAGYILACVATGPQNAQDRVLVFFGENHHEIYKHFELLTKCTSAIHVQRRPREYVTIRSANPAGFSTTKKKLT